MTLRQEERLDVEVASNRGALIAIAAVLVTVTNALAFMLPPLLPAITISYAHNSTSAATWIFTALTLGGGAGFVLIPRLADMLSDRAIALVSGTFLTAGALVAAVLDSYAGLIVGSVLLGFGGASQLVPMSFLRRHLGAEAVSTAVMVLIMATGTGVVLGMVGGGLSVRVWPLADHLNADGSLPTLSIAPFYYILAGLFVLTTIGLLVIVPNSPGASKDRLGITGTVWLIGSVTLILLAFSAPSTSFVGKHAPLVLLVGIVSTIAWALTERRSKKQVFDLAVLRKPYVATACAAACLFGCIDAAYLVLTNYYLQTPSGLPEAVNGGATGWPTDVAHYGLGLDPLQASLLLLPFALTMFISGRFAERLVARGRPGSVIVAGALISLVGLLFLAVAHDQAWDYIVGSAIIGFGSRAGYSGTFAVPQLAVPEDQAGMAAAMPGTLMAIGFAIGAAVVTTIQTGSSFVYHSVDVAALTAGELSPRQVDVARSDYLLDGASFPLPDTYTTAYFVTAGFALLILVLAAVTRLRNPSGFKTMLEDQGA